VYFGFINKNYLYAVVGNMTDTNKYGYIVLRDLLAGGYRAVGVDPKYKGIHPGLEVYGNLTELGVKPDVLVLVVRPTVGREVLKQAVSFGVTKVWCQPGAASEELKTDAEQKGVDLVADGSCIMVVRRVVK